MMNSILKQSLLGTAHPVPVELNEPFSRISSSLPDKEEEKKFLLTAGALCVYRLAGYRPPKIERGISPSREENLQECNEFISRLVKNIVTGSAHPKYMREIIPLMEKKGQRVPHEMLPVVLDSPGFTDRASLLPILGERGEWLSQFKKEWNWVGESRREKEGKIPDDLEMLWDTDMTHRERVALLEKMRHADPARARGLVERIWSKEKAENRRGLMDSFEIALTREDEPFLEQALTDRSAAVGEKAASLLARIENASFAQKLREYADSMVYASPESLQKKKSGQPKSKSRKSALSIVPPQKLEKEWEKLSLFKLETSRASYLVQIVSLIDPGRWEKLFSLTPQEIIDSVNGDDWEEPFIIGLSEAALLHDNIPWKISLWDYWFAHDCKKKDLLLNSRRLSFLNRLLKSLPPREKKERIWLFLDDSPGYGLDWSCVLDGDVSLWEEMGDDFLGKLEAWLGSTNPDNKNTEFVWNALLPDLLGFNLPSHLFDKALDRSFRLPESEGWSARHQQNLYKKCMEIIETRKRILEEIGS